MEKKIRAAFFDIDNTILSHTMHKVPESAVYALAKLKEKGILVFCATGRHVEEVKKLPLQGIDFDGGVTLNGAYCFDKNEEIYECEIGEENIRILLEELEKHPMPVAFTEKDRVYLNYPGKAAEDSMRKIECPLPETGDLKRGLDHRIYLFTIFAEDDSWKPVVEKMDNVVASSWHEGAIDVNSVKTNKSVGIRKVCEHYGFSRDEAIAFGDGFNDVRMIRKTGIGVAVGNARDEVKAVADYVTDPIDDDGIYHALVHYGLIEDDYKFPNE